MTLKTLTENDLRESDFVNTFADFIVFDKDSCTLIIKKLKLHSSDSNKMLLTQVKSKFVPNNLEVKILHLSEVEFEADNVTFLSADKLVLSSCSITKEATFAGYPREVEIINCDIPKFNFYLGIPSLKVIDSNIGVISIGFGASGESNVKTINIQGKSSIYKITGLHTLLRNETGTVVIFSQESKIVADAEESYRIMRLISNKFGDAVQSHIFHTKAVELYSRYADDDTKTLLFFEKWTNDFGRSIFLPIFWMIIFNFLSILILVYFSNNFCVDGFWDLFGSILNIGPWSSFIPEDVNRISWEFSLDSIRRVLLAILTYQVIISARRFSFSRK